MTVSSADNSSGPYDGDGVSVAFVVDFYFLEDKDIAVLKRDAAGNETQLMLATDYTVVGAGSEGGGAVTLSAAPAVGERVAIVRDVDLTQTRAFPEGGRFPARTVETALDKVTMAIQQLRELVSRSVVLQATSTARDIILPDPTAGLPLGWDPAGTGDIVNLEALGGWKGEWATGTAYDAGDVVKDAANGNLYVARVAHTSGATIAADETAGNLFLAVDVQAVTDAQTAAEAAQTAAETAETNAAASESTASASAAAAAGSASTAAAEASAAGSSATVASGAATDAQAAQAAAETARDKAQDWAENPEDVAVDPGLFSALHHAAKAAASATAAASSESAAAAFAAGLTPIPTGGAAGQALLKASGSDYDYEWGDVGGVTVDVVSNVAADRLLGRVSAGSGDSEELTPAQARTLLNVEDGATADQTGSEIAGALDAELGSADWRTGGGGGRTIASQATAETGIDNTKGMTPLRTAQAIAAQVGPVARYPGVDGIEDALDGATSLTGNQSSVSHDNTGTLTAFVEGEIVGVFGFWSACSITGGGGGGMGPEINSSTDVVNFIFRDANGSPGAGAIHDEVVTGLDSAPGDIFRVMFRADASERYARVQVLDPATGAVKFDEARTAPFASSFTGTGPIRFGPSNASQGITYRRLVWNAAIDRGVEEDLFATSGQGGGTVDVVSNLAADRLLGRVSAGSGDSEELTAAQVRTLLNVEDGATADQTGAEIVSVIDAELGQTSWKSGGGGAANWGLITGALSAQSDLQSALNNKANNSHGHLISGVTGLQSALDDKLDVIGQGAEIKTAYEGEANTNAFTDADQSKLDGIEAGAQANRAVATQADAEAGTDAAKGMTPERTKQAIDALAPAAVMTGATAIEVVATLPGSPDANTIYFVTT